MKEQLVKGLPDRFLYITFSVLITWVLVANYWDLICEVVSKMFNI